MPSARSLLLVPALLLLACGDSVERPPGTRANNTSSNNGNTTNNASGPTVVPEHATVCNQACTRATEAPCQGADLTTCTSRCAAKTNGLSEACAACLMSESGYAGRSCTCYGAGCALCPFAPGDTACGGAAPGDVCAVEDEVCDGFEAAELIGGACETLCLDDEANPPDLAATLRDRCNQVCADRPGACASASTTDCVSSCLGQATGVEPTCAVCRIERSGWAGQACTCYGAGCNLCGFGPSPRACSSALPEDTCAAEEETCRGLELGPLDEECADYCL